LDLHQIRLLRPELQQRGLRVREQSDDWSLILSNFAASMCFVNAFFLPLDQFL
jgi:hypothetical protein